MLRWGLIAPGGIARRFADAFAVLPGQRLQRVAARDPAKAQAFAAHWGGAAAPDIEALCADPEVDIVYVASPHSAHAEHARLALAAGKPVLCEKPLTPTLAQTRALLDLSATHRVFLMEALWSRFLPVYDQVAQWLRSGAIGAVRTMQWRMYDCFRQQRFPELKYTSQTSIDLITYLGVKAKGGTMEAPAIKR